MSYGEQLLELSERIEKREEQERKRRSEGTATSPLHVAASGGAAFNREFYPWGFLTERDLKDMEQISESLNWPDQALAQFGSRDRRNIVQSALKQCIEDGIEEPAAAEVLLEERRDDLVAKIATYEFLFPVNNLEVAEGTELPVGKATVRPLSSDDWGRFCGEAWEAIERQDAWETPEEKGRVLANRLSLVDPLRDKSTEDELQQGCLLVETEGSPETAYRQARQEAHFALSCLTLFNAPWDERAGRFLALKGEERTRENGWRVRFGNALIGPAAWSDGTGPGLPFQLGDVDQDTREFYEALTGIVEDPSAYGERILRAIHWTGAALNVPVLDEDEDGQRADQHAGAMAAKPTGFERCQRLTSLITALEAILKFGDDENQYDVRPRAEDLLDSLDPDPSAATIESRLEDAYTARNKCAHEGHGTPSLEQLTTVAGVLSMLISELVPVCDVYLDDTGDLEDLREEAQQGESWEKTLARIT